MSDVYASVEYRRLTKNNVRFVRFVFALNKFQALKPNQVNDSCTVREMPDQTALPSFAKGFEAQYLSAQLDVRHIPVYLMNVIKPAAVYVFIRKLIQKVLEGTDVQFLLQNGSPMGAYSL